MATRAKDIQLLLEQYPAPHQQKVRHAGSSLRVTLTLDHDVPGEAFLRTNLGNAHVHWLEIVEHYEQGKAIFGRDWNDLPMRKIDGKHYEIILPLTQIGLFDFKAYFRQKDNGRVWWVRGENSRIKVQSALTIANNTIYNAFVRQFGAKSTAVNSKLSAAISQLDAANWTVIPPSGTFREVSKHLDFIQNELGFRILQFLPVHPTPTTFARMGRYGSPFAPLDFFDVDASMAEFDRRTTPIEQFSELIGQVHGRGGLVFIDLPIDHTGWGSMLQSHHPEWFAREADGSFKSPGAWGVVWEDLCKLDFQHTELWKSLANVFLHWCKNGIDGFRCDAGYMVPAPAWEYIIARVRLEFPDTIFFLEGLGGGMDATTKLLSEAGMDWAYSELFQNYTSSEVSHYIDFAGQYSKSIGPLVHFAETHDNERLAVKGATWSKMRVAMSALYAPAGCFGIANGVEWLATEKIDVHEAKSLNWGAEPNLTGWIKQLNTLLREHPAFKGDSQLRVPFGAAGSGTGLLRIPKGAPQHTVLAVVNPNVNEPAEFAWHSKEFAPRSSPVDLLTGRKVPVRYDQCLIKVALRPAEVLCLADADAELPLRKVTFVERQCLRSTALKFLIAQRGFCDIANLDIEALALALYGNPLEFLKQLNGSDVYLPIVEWYPNKDERRTVLLPPKHHLFVNHDQRFIAFIVVEGRCIQKIHAMPRADGRFFALFEPLKRQVRRSTPASLIISICQSNGENRMLRAPLMLIPGGDAVRLTTGLMRNSITNHHIALATGQHGTYGMLRAAWGNLESQYDAMLAVSQHPSMPVDKTIVLNRCRIWVVYRDFSHPVNLSCQTEFAVTAPNAMRWNFIVPTGMGGSVYLSIRYELDRKTDQVKLVLSRSLPAEETELAFAARDIEEPVTILVRPDIDDRSFHGNTAIGAREHVFPARVQNGENFFAFTLDSGRHLEMRTQEGHFLPDPEWQRGVFHRIESERGLNAKGDLFSPGYFRFTLNNNSSALITAAVLHKTENLADTPAPATLKFREPAAQKLSLAEALRQAIDAFVVQRDQFKTVVAGYPWFLDWGRDTLLCALGLCDAGRLDDVLAIIRIFASYEANGTLPNMISGTNVSNRDTSDAPLLLFKAVQAYLDASGTDPQQLLAAKCGKRTLAAVLVSIVENYLKGTPNGIAVDAESGLVFSPAHFTWMDTNYPAATPREGYPIELQAFWFSALKFLAKYAGEEKYDALAEKVRASVLKYYPAGKFIGLADCLHATKGVPAAKAVPDDHARPNQLLAITNGLIDDPLLKRHILQSCSALLVPGAMRSLADQPVNYRLPVERQGKLLNNPQMPYWGHYAGDEDTQRKPAYHNGTAWVLLMPFYCEALYDTYGDSAKDAAKAILATAADLMKKCCVGQLPEIVDGNSGHEPRGCCAQAWSATECYRVLKKLTR